MRIILLGILCLSVGFYANAQTTFYVNGVADEKSDFMAYTHATVYVNATTVLYDATLLVKKGKVEGVLEKGAVPKGAFEINLKGKTIYPSFVDLYSHYGINVPQSNKLNSVQSEQFNTSKAGAFAWNEALKPEINAAEVFNTQETIAGNYRNAGFGCILTGNSDGICRGTTALVSTANVAPHQGILAQQVTSSFSFNKGSSKQNYPSSLMGSIALIRQTYYDAQWYKNQTQEKNISLQHFSALLNIPAVFDAGNKQNVLRAAALAKEFKANYLIKTAGDDYQRVKEIKQTGLPLIVPINFPKAYKINDVYEADLLSTADLKHWELAPANLYWLWKNNVVFCITYYGCEKPQDFLNNLRKAVSYGLPKQEALKALTTTPASLIHQPLIGHLQAGAEANFMICSGDLFASTTQVLKHVVQGKMHEVNGEELPKLADVYVGKSEKSFIELRVKKNQAIIDADTFKLTVRYSAGLVHVLLDGSKMLSFSANPTRIDSSASPYLINELSGFAKGPGGVTSMWVLSSKADSLVKNQSDTGLTILPDSLIWFPFADYGTPQLNIVKKVLFKNATVWTNEVDGILTQTDVLINNGKISMVGKSLQCNDCEIIDATNKHLTNGIIDEHSHIAIQQGVNEGTQAVTSEVRIGDVVNADDINIYRQLAGGVTSAQLLHGSANPIGGQSCLIKLRWGQEPDKMKIGTANGYIKFALGENVKQANWGDQATVRFPQTRMGVEQVFVDAFTRAKEYELKLKTEKNIRRDLELDALVEVLNRKRYITCHSYVQSEINMLMHVADSFGFRVNTFTHILEGYKVADKMKKHGVNASTFADWWGYKYEVIDAIPYNAAILNRMGVTVAINSDDAEMGRRLNQEAAKTIKYGNLSEEEAWKTVTLNPAKMLRLDANLGSIKVGKEADLVLWDNNPLSIYAKVAYTFIDGICYYSSAHDANLRAQIKQTRDRIISKMLLAQKNGGESQSYISPLDVNYHCND
jgi:imidazolonepropionase-like amidohydrolase